MKLTKADRELISMCGDAITNSLARPPRMAEVGCRSAEIAATLMAEFPRLHVDLCGDWNNFAELPWVEQQHWSGLYDRAMSRTDRTPARRRMYKCYPSVARSLIAQYSVAACCFSDAIVTCGWDGWYSLVEPSGVMCGVRSTLTDANIEEWSKRCRVPVLFTQWTWWAGKPR